MPAGTITLTNNSTSVTGSETSFTTELKANDFIVAVVGGVTYTLGVQSVNSATSVTLINAYGGPTTSGLAWNAVANAALVGITAQLAADVAKSIRGLNLDKANWQQVYSASGNITVTLPDGSQYSGPSWNSVVNSVSGKVDKSQNLGDLADKSAAWKNLIDGRTAATARTDLGLKSLALQDQIDRTDLNTETFRNLFAAGAITANLQGAGIWTFNNTPLGYNEQYGTCIQVNNRTDTSGAAGSGIWQHYLALGTGGNVIYATNINGTYTARKLYSTSNTTTNSSGALVPASPIVRIVNSRDTSSRSDLLGVNNEEYTWTTVRGLCNEESKGCTVSRTDTGTYLIKGAIGLAKDLWSVMDCGNGQGRIIALAEAEETEEGVVVRCYKQKYTLTEDGDLTVGKGALIDIPDETWIDVRLEMPADSAYNQRQQEVASQMNEQHNEIATS
ncbi:hypothetical protein MHZ90_17925 [Pantoea sp. ACRSH]|uniref:phage tail fiber protein n=1 Tax=unclassified Pantoea TaxID=2630326 RepID=UPI001EF40CFA|nr:MULTISPECIES: hypothetical protein [unclassified Pantoea]MCG7367990.1 hypothetical protein [Pantoea sp. ACRSH]MCG7398349.1 hypothetical protein [Pantoea sp. ACRSC]